MTDHLFRGQVTVDDYGHRRQFLAEGRDETDAEPRAKSAADLRVTSPLGAFLSYSGLSILCQKLIHAEQAGWCADAWSCMPSNLRDEVR